MTKKAKDQKRQKAELEKLAFGKNNYIAFAAGLLVVLSGFFFLSKGSMTLAPILLVMGYCVIIPIAILIKGDKFKNEMGE